MKNGKFFSMKLEPVHSTSSSKAVRPIFDSLGLVNKFFFENDIDDGLDQRTNPVGRKVREFQKSQRAKGARWLEGTKVNSWTSDEDEENGKRQPLVAMKPADINVVGMRQVFGGDHRIIVRAFWGTVLLLLLCVFITQFSDRLNHYLSNPVKVTMKIKRATEMVFPSVTLCYEELYNPERSKPYEIETAKVLGVKESDVTLSEMMAVFNSTELWLNIGFQIEDIFKECFFGRNLSCQSQGTFLPTLTTMGLCHKYVPGGHVSNSGRFNNFYARLKGNPVAPKTGWKLFLGGAEGTPALRVTTSSMTIYPNLDPDIQVSVKEFRTLHTTQDPCDATSTYSQLDCEMKCFEDAFRAIGGCWLPYMTQESMKTIPECLSPGEVNRSMELSHTLLYGGNWTSYRCNCLSACDDVIYESFSDSRAQKYPTTRVRIFYNDLTYQSVNEVWAYGIISFMCDVGGALGLLLGASVLTFIEIIQCVFNCCSKEHKG